MHFFGLELSWEAIQTALLWARSRFVQQPPAPVAKGGEKTEEPLKQQVTSNILPTRDDEAILIAIDAALASMDGGPEHLANVQLVRETLESHQNDDWRKNIGSIKMTERFENVMASETIIRTNRGEQDQADLALPQRRRGGRDQERVDRKFERRPIDYEWTDLDPRVRHLILVSRIVTRPGPQGGVPKAKEYLISAGFIKKQSAAQQAAEAAEKSGRAAANTINRFVGGVRSNDATLARIETALKASPGPTPEEKRALEQERDRYLARRSREANVRREEQDRSATRRFRCIVAAFIVAALILAAII